MRPFSGSVNRKKIVDSAKLDGASARRGWPRTVERNRNRNLFGELHPEAFLVFPSVSPDLFMRFHEFRCFFLASSLSPLPSLCSLLGRDGIWNLPPLRLDLVCESPVLPLIVRYSLLSNVSKHVARITITNYKNS